MTDYKGCQGDYRVFTAYQCGETRLGSPKIPAVVVGEGQIGSSHLCQGHTGRRGRQCAVVSIRERKRVCVEVDVDKLD